MFSTRFHWDAGRNRLTEQLAVLRARGARILDLTQSNPTQAAMAYPAGLCAVFDDPAVLRYEPVPAGAACAREAVAGYYLQRGQVVEPDRILLTASTSEAYSYLFKLLTDPGDQVLVPRPSYPLFEYLANMESIEVRQYPLEYHGGWAIDIDGLAGAITARTRGVVLVNPNNPTGSFIKRSELEALVRIATARGIALISDEVFADYAFAADPARVSSLAGVEDCAAFSMSGLSKIAGLPQMKLGWIAVAGPKMFRAAAMDKLEWIADTYLSVSTTVQCAAPRLLELGQQIQAQIRARTAANLAFARQAVNGTAVEILAVEGGWSIILRVPRVRTEEEWCLKLLNESNVLLQPGYFYDFAAEAFLVASLLTAPDDFEEGLKRLLAQEQMGP